MRRTTFIHLLLLVVLSSFSRHNTFRVDGYLDDVSPNQEWVLYRVPNEWETGEYQLGTLQALNTKTRAVIVLDEVFIEEASSFFLTDSIVAIPMRGCIKLYNLYKKALEEIPLLTFNKEYDVLQFSVSEDKSKVALLLLDRNNKVEDTLADRLRYRVELKIVDLKTGQEYVVEKYDYDSESHNYSGDILWHKDGIVYSYQSNLYYYELGQKEPLLIADYVGKYALHGDVLIFPTNTNINKFNFFDQSVTKVISKNSPLDPRQDYEFYTVHNCGVKQAALRIDDKQKYYYYILDSNYEFKQQEKLMLYQDKRLSIQLLLTSIPYGEYYLTKEELLIKI